MSNYARPAVYCQNCRAPNNLSEPFCSECGTRLMIVVFPNSLQYDTNVVPSYYEDHLLERVSTLETRLSQVMDRLENAYDFIERFFETVQNERLIMEKLVTAVGLSQPEIAEMLTRKHLKTLENVVEKQTFKKRQKEILKEIIENHGNPNNEIFSGLVREGIKLLKKNEEKEAFQMLERAAMLSPQNVPLHLFVAAKLYRAEKIADAQKHLEKILRFDAENPKIKLFLAALNADANEFQKARNLLTDLPETANSEKVVAFIKGFLSAYEQNHHAAVLFLSQFTETAEDYYLLGCLYYEAENYVEALKNLENAVLSDSDFSDAWLMQAVIHQLQDNRELEAAAVEKAAESAQNGSQSLEYLKNGKYAEIKSALPFAHFNRKNRRILTGGALRIAKYFRQMLLDSIEE